MPCQPGRVLESVQAAAPGAPSDNDRSYAWKGARDLPQLTERATARGPSVFRLSRRGGLRASLTFALARDESTSHPEGQAPQRDFLAVLARDARFVSPASPC